MKEKIKEVCSSLIYHGRHFSKTRDKIVVKKSVDYLMKILKGKK